MKAKCTLLLKSDFDHYTGCMLKSEIASNYKIIYVGDLPLFAEILLGPVSWCILDRFEFSQNGHKKTSKICFTKDGALIANL